MNLFDKRFKIDTTIKTIDMTIKKNPIKTLITVC